MLLLYWIIFIGGILILFLGSGIFFKIWIIICSLTLAILAGFPLISGLLADPLPAAAAEFMASFSTKNMVAGIGLIICVFLIFRSGRLSMAGRVATVTALLWIAAFIGPLKAIDHEKSMQQTVKNFFSQIPSEKRSRVAGLDFSETMRGYFYYYGNWSYHRLQNQQGSGIS